MKRRALLTCVLAVLAGCAKKKTRVPPVATPPARVPPAAAEPGATERGLASWYGKPYHGRAAADGEIYDMETLVAAHRTLPFQTVVRVKNLSNGQTVNVRIIDRGPFVKGRIIDLSHAAAVAIGLIGPGVGQVELTIAEAPANPAAGFFAVQVGAFRDKGNADRMETRMLAAYGAGKAVLRAGDPPVWRILAGRETSPANAELLARRVRTEQQIPEAFVVRLD
jgi:rare lipoprotein A